MLAVLLFELPSSGKEKPLPVFGSDSQPANAIMVN